MMIAKTCDGEKGKDIKTFCDKVRTPVMMLIIIDAWCTLVINESITVPT